MAKRSAKAIHRLFIAYFDANDFVADMARKFLQMGFTRSRRFANYKGGRKYDKQNGHKLAPHGTGDPAKAKSAGIFHDY